MEQKLLNWIKGQQNTIDQIIFEAGNNFYLKNRSQENFYFDLSECQAESFNLIGNKDLCYDRPSTGFVYSLWYHARRVNTFIKFFASAIVNSSDKVIEIFDLGAGTGAVQFAVALVYSGMRELNMNPPKFRIINIDSSPIMLYYNRDFLWESFLKYYPNLNQNNQYKIEYSINSWNVPFEYSVTNPWVVASYLFDISDQESTISSHFLELVNYYKPNTLLLLTSNQTKKVALLNSILKGIKSNGYSVDAILDSSLLFEGPLPKVNQFRKELANVYFGKGLGSTTNWKDNSFIGATLKKTAQSLNLIDGAKLNSIELYNSKIKVRRDVKLSDQQERASRFHGRPSTIIGPAGSGKSVVLSEKIKHIVNNAPSYNPKMKILVTSFNRGLIKKIGDWIENLLDHRHIKRQYITDIHGYADEACYFYFTDSTIPNITLLNFDLLPTKIGKITADRLLGNQLHLNNIKQYCIQVLKRSENIIDDRFDNILNPEFILEEYHRVIYGLNIK